MIMKPRNWENVQAMTERMKLPLGAYVCRIKKAVVQNNGYGDQLAILFDIVEGEHSGFYARDFEANQNADRKWKGLLRQWIPVDDGSDGDEMTKRVLKGLVTSLEKSNPGYTWNWDESSMAGKMIGILFRNEEWEWQGKNGWAVRPFRALSVDSVRNGDYTLPKDKPLNNGGASRQQYSSAPEIDQPTGYQKVEADDDLPF